ncbi:MAG: efflux RND transporter periplasmic adaptor subunit [Gemmatimonadota bacterium]|nr:efflux RND transporter periplasmic adaptor subunit [Gemmatimonadota bacterium]
MTSSRLPVWLALAAGAACGGDAVPESTPAAPGTAELVAVDSAIVARPVELTGQLYVEHDAMLYTRAGGVVEHIAKDLGAHVRAGDTLARLESVDQEIALASALADSVATEQQVRRVRTLSASGVVTTADSERIELQYQQAQLVLRQARRNLELTRVIAPFGGVVTQRQLRPGRLAAEGDPAFRLSALAPLLISVQLPERAPAPRPGDRAPVVTLDGTVVAATVARVSPIVDAASGTREVVLRVPGGPEIRPGMTVRVRLPAELATMPIIPRDALGDTDQVLLWDRGRVVLRTVTLGDTLPDGRVVVLDGVVPGDTIVPPAR